MSAPLAIHASAVAVGESCVLLRGPSGSGKSAAALALIDLAGAHGLFARLVADDRVLLEARGGRLIASPHPAIAGLIERRGEGIDPAPHLPRAVVALAVDLTDRSFDPPRMPAPEALRVLIGGVTVPRILATGSPVEVAAAALDRLRRLWRKP